LEKNLKRLLKTNFLLFACLFANETYSQYPVVRERLINLPSFDQKTIHYGYFLGANQYDFKFEYIENYYEELLLKDVAVDQKKGFSVGLIGDLRINQYLNLRFEPGLFYNRRELIYPEYPEFTKENDRYREISNQKNSDDNASNVFRTTIQNLNYELGLGFDFYLYYFKFSPSLRGIFSFQNEMIPDNDPQSPWTGKINTMFSRGVALIITFE
jgi:hypothetical protein